jgi:hypothetical protein
VSFEKKDEVSNIFEDQFYIDSVERYNVKYKPPAVKQPSANEALQTPGAAGNNTYINGGSGASGGIHGGN